MLKVYSKIDKVVKCGVLYKNNGFCKKVRLVRFYKRYLIS